MQVQCAYTRPICLLWVIVVDLRTCSLRGVLDARFEVSKHLHGSKATLFWSAWGWWKEVSLTICSGHGRPECIWGGGFSSGGSRISKLEKCLISCRGRADIWTLLFPARFLSFSFGSPSSRWRATLLVGGFALDFSLGAREAPAH